MHLRSGVPLDKKSEWPSVRIVDRRGRSTPLAPTAEPCDVNIGYMNPIFTRTRAADSYAGRVRLLVELQAVGFA